MLSTSEKQIQDSSLTISPTLQSPTKERILKKSRFVQYIGEYQKNSISRRPRFWGEQSTIFQYVYNNLKKQPGQFKIGILSIVLVVLFLTVLASLIKLTSLIYLRSSESQVGDMDMILLPLQYGNNTINSSQSQFMKLIDTQLIEKVVEQIYEIEGVASRWYLTGEIQRNDNKKTRVYLILLDFVKELNIGFGRNNELEPLGTNEAYITYDAMRLLGFTEDQNEQINLTMDLFNSIFKENQQNLNPEFNVSSKDDLNNLLMNSSYMNNNSNVSQLIALRELVNGFPKDNITEEEYKNLVNQSGVPEDLANELIYIYNGTQSNKGELIKKLDFVPLGLSTGQAVLDSVQNFSQTINVKRVLRRSQGKWPEMLGNVLLMEGKYFLKEFRDIMYMNINRSIEEYIEQQSVQKRQILRILWEKGVFKQQLNQTLEQFDIERYTMTSNIIFRNKQQIYTSVEELNNNLVRISNKLMSLLGTKGKQYKLEAPLGTVYSSLLIVNAFLNNILVSLLGLLVLLSCILIYSLLLSNVNQKTYEYGMLRALGLGQVKLINLLGVNALVFVVPGVAVSLVISYIMYNVLAYNIYQFTQLYQNYTLNGIAICLGVTVGVLVPLISNIYPIKRALGKSLRDSLDVYHRVIVNELSIKFLKLEQMGLQSHYMATGIMLICFGFTAYYIVPYTYINQYMELFIYILNGVLLLMLFGLNLIVNMVQYLCQVMILRIMLLISRDIKLQPIILKNMKSHKRRNSQTGLMFSIAIAFLIFGGVSLKLQGKVIQNQIKMQYGSDILVRVTNTKNNNNEYGLQEYQLKQFLEQYTDQIKGYSFVSYYLNELIPQSSSLRVSSLDYFPSCQVDIVGVQENLLDSVFSDLYIPNKYDSNMINSNIVGTDKVDGVKGLFVSNGLLDIQIKSDSVSSNVDIRGNSTSNVIDNNIIKVIIGQGLRSSLSLDIDIPGLIYNSGVTYLVKVCHLVTKLPGFSFSGYYQQQNKQTILVNMQQYGYILQNNSGNNILKSRLFIQLQDNIKEKEQLLNGLRNIINTKKEEVIDVQQLVIDSNEVLNISEIFYVLIGIISICLSFFLLLVSFVQNVHDNLTELAVLRAIGLNKQQITKLYLHEAFALTISAGILGSLVGCAVAILFNQQITLFTEVQLSLEIPYTILSPTYILSLVTAVLAPYYAVQDIKHKSISDLLKGI